MFKSRFIIKIQSSVTDKTTLSEVRVIKTCMMDGLFTKHTLIHPTIHQAFPTQECGVAYNRIRSPHKKVLSFLLWGDSVNNLGLSKQKWRACL